MPDFKKLLEWMADADRVIEVNSEDEANELVQKIKNCPTTESFGGVPDEEE